MMDKMILKVVPANKLIFFEKSKVYVLVSGSILMQCHQEKSDSANTFAKYRCGEILNFMQTNSELFNSHETWFQAQVDSEIVEFEKPYFEQIWEEDLVTDDLALKRVQMASYNVFSDLSELAMTALVSEYIQVRKYQ